ncbi:MAG: efflux RND transporter permease subunit [Candidatus Aminicenantes bacterium]|nr:efflux RND transporter permease subunit [Candidatus Aminicenantes bacterium]
MKSLIERPVATAMIFVALLVLGIYSFINTPLELAPKEEFPRLDVSTPWQGVPPEIVQTQVTSPLEEACATVKGVTKVTSTSQIGSSLITLEFDPKTNMDFALLALREELAKTRRLLPAGVRPTVQPYVPDDFRVNPFLSMTISGPYSLQRLREMVNDKLEFGLGSIKGVSKVEILGGAEAEVKIILDKKAMKAYNLQPLQVNSALSQRLRTYPTGRVRKGEQEYLFKYADAVDSLQEIRDTIVADLGGHPLRIRDVAEVAISYGEIYSIHRINGQPTVSLTLTKEKGANTLRVAAQVKAALERIKKELPSDLAFKPVDDESEEIRKNLADLYRLAGLITVIIFILVFAVLRRVKPSLLILSSIAFSVVITFNLIYLFKVSMNMLTLGALALGFGMFVDNSIVVFDNILRLRERGMSPKEAAVQGPKEVFVAVLASTLTTVAVFCSFPFFQGKLKIYYLPLAIVITSALLASLVVSYTLIPALAPRLLGDGKKKAKPPKARGEGRWLRFLIRRPLEVLLVVAFILGGTYKWFRSEVSIGEWFRWTQHEYLVIQIGLPAGTDISRTDEAIRAFESKVLEQPYATDMNTRVMMEQAYLRIEFPPEIERSAYPYMLKEELIQLATQFAGMNLYVSGFDQNSYASSMGTGTMFGSQIKFTGYNLKKLKEITADLTKTLKRNPRVKEVQTSSSRWGWYRGDTFENILKIDKAALRKYDVDPLTLYYHLQTLIQGKFGRPARIISGGKEIAVGVKFPDAETLDLRALQETLVRTRGGEYLRLGEIATHEEIPIAGSIDRENQQFQLTLLWEFRGPAKAEERYRKGIFASLSLPPGFKAEMDQGYRMTTEEKKQIFVALGVSLVIIFMILAALYESFIQPFFILLAVPLSLIGVWVAFIVAGWAFDVSAYIGVILLNGIVVNNAILLVDQINLRRRRGTPLLEAAVQGTQDRVRPILMTTGTTVLGMLPMLLIVADAAKRQIWTSLALCTVGGLVTSSLAILFVVPVFYVHGEKVRGWAARLSDSLRGKK